MRRFKTAREVYFFLIYQGSYTLKCPDFFFSLSMHLLKLILWLLLHHFHALTLLLRENDGTNLKGTNCCVSVCFISYLFSLGSIKTISGILNSTAKIIGCVRNFKNQKSIKRGALASVKIKSRMSKHKINK